MNRHNYLPSLNVTFGGLAEFPCQDDAAGSQLRYQGMSVQVPNSPSPVYFSRSNADQSNDHSIDPLNEFRVAPLMQAVSDNFDELDLPVNPESFPDKCVPWNSDDGPVDDGLLSEPSSYLFYQSFFLGRKPDIGEPAPSSHLNPDYHLTNLPAELANPQDSRPVAVASSLNLQQSKNDKPASSSEIVDDKSLQVEHERELDRNNPAYAEYQRERSRQRRRDRYHNDPVYAQRSRQRQRDRYRNDPVYAQRRRDRQKERLRKRCQNDPAYAERERARQRERRKNPAYAERLRVCQRERYHNNPAFAERQKMRKRERYRNDRVYAESHKIYNTTYKRMKKKFSKEEASKLASVARKEYLQSVNYPEGSDNLPQTSNSAETIQNFNNNLDTLPPIPAQTE